MWGKFCGYGANAAMASLTRARAGEIAATPAGPTFVDSVFKDARGRDSGGIPPPNEVGKLVRAVQSAGSNYAPFILSDMERGCATECEFTIQWLPRTLANPFAVAVDRPLFPQKDNQHEENRDYDDEGD